LNDHFYSQTLVLKSTSTINLKLYYPWDDVDGLISTNNEELFVDPQGMLELSEDQQKHFDSYDIDLQYSPFRWKRPSEFVPTESVPVMINIISAYSITQSVVTDCSFVASLSGILC
jgi:calpain-7